MPTWGQLNAELAKLGEGFTPVPGATQVSPHDILRRKYLKLLRDRTGRTTFLYYSGWLDTPDAPPEMLSLTTMDMAGFMEACSNVVDSRELDLFLHSPGGDPDAAEQVCAYLRTQFDHIRAVVPVAAMSAATMVALSADEVLMGDHSQLGPIDPQLTIRTPEGPRSASAQAIKDQFSLAQEECKDPQKLTAWMPVLRSLAPGLLAACDHAAKRAEAIVATAMEKHMLRKDDDAAKKAGDTAAWFGNAAELLSHGRPVRRDEAREHNVVVNDLEEDSELQDLVLSVHHAAMLTLSGTPTVKLIENDKGRAFIRLHATASGPQLVIQQGPPPDQKKQKQAAAARKPPPSPPRKRGKRRR